jgi:antitoxin component of MazEF toxin-antitoxin module
LFFSAKRITLRHTKLGELTIRQQGNSLGISFPAETRIRLGLEAGQELTLAERADGIKLVKRNLALERPDGAGTRSAAR